MISKFRKLQDTWFAKTILILTGLSFMSLFGVAGYMGSVGKNRPVIKVDNFELLQGDAYALLDKEVQVAKQLFGDKFEVTDAIRHSMLQDIVQKNLNNMIIQNIAKKNSVSIADDLVKQVIFAQKEFKDAEGKFDINRLRQILAASGWSEQQYINSIKLDIIKQNIIQTPIENINTPKTLLKYMAKINNQQRVFKYITVDPTTLKIDRNASEEEILQYYQDFNLNFMAPETRDISFFYVSNADIIKQIKISDEEAEEYYKGNSAQFETPETRKVLQMVFDSEEKANEAIEALNKNEDFYGVAKKLANQEKADTDLGFVAKDMLLEELSEAVFNTNKGAISGPIQTTMGWHIVKIDDIKAGSKVDKNKALAKIKETLTKDKLYDHLYTLASQIEDKAGAGDSFESIAESLKTKVYTAKNINENGEAKLSDKNMKDIVSASDFIDMAFSYNAGEISQVIEFDDGFALIKVDAVYDSHPKDIEEVRPEIVKLWENNERTAIAQEIVNDVIHDLESGDDITDIAKRFNLNLKTTAPLNRKQEFADLSEYEMKDLFLEKVGAPRIINHDGKVVIVVTSKIINSDAKESDDEAILRQAKLDLYQEYANRLLSDFSSDYDVRVKYRLLGLAD